MYSDLSGKMVTQSTELITAYTGYIPNVLDDEIHRLRKSLSAVCHCDDTSSCRSLRAILQVTNNPIDEETAWSLLHQLLNLLRNYRKSQKAFKFLDSPEDLNNICLHPDGKVHLQWSDEDLRNASPQSNSNKADQNVLKSIGILIYKAVDFNLGDYEQSKLSEKFQKFFKFLVLGNVDNEKAFQKYAFSKLRFLDYALEKCKSRVTYRMPTFHYMEMCSSLYERSMKSREHGDGDDEPSSDENFSVSDETNCDDDDDISTNCDKWTKTYANSVWDHNVTSDINQH